MLHIYTSDASNTTRYRITLIIKLEVERIASAASEFCAGFGKRRRWKIARGKNAWSDRKILPVSVERADKNLRPTATVIALALPAIWMRNVDWLFQQLAGNEQNSFTSWSSE